MIIAVASGKGGTGKTTIATSLALSLIADSDAVPPLLFLDCDVEAPNAHLFLKPVFDARRDVSLPIPQVDEMRCTYCGKCAEVCQYHAIAVLGKRVLVFPQLCHGCGSCTLICPEKAIREVPEVIGVLERGRARAGFPFAQGVLNIGEPMAVPVIRQLKKWVEPQPDQVIILDASPGTSCPVVETIRGADYLLLVTEPTPFGLHDLRLAAEISRELNIPAGVIINRDDAGFSAVDEFCLAEGITVLLRIPFERSIAEGIARGQTLIEILPEYNERFQGIYAQIVLEIRQRAVT